MGKEVEDGVPGGLGEIIDAGVEEDEKLQELCDEKGAVLLAFIGSHVPREYNPAGSGSATIDIAGGFEMEEALKEIRRDIAKANTKKAHLLINSVGGGAGSSFKIAQAIRDMFDDITVFVPHIAADGGMLLALTGDRIRMGMMSQLSPVDPQMPYPGHGFVSASSISRAKKRLDKKFEKRQGRVGYTDRRMAEMLDPAVYEESLGARKASEGYLSTILKRAKYTQEEIDVISDSLIFGLPTHDFVIGKDLAEEMGLKVASDEEDADEWDLMRDWLARYVVEETDRHFIRYCIPKKED